jgi:small-conductance mechanosensitive channel
VENIPYIDQITEYAILARDLALAWLTSPAAWVQFGLLVVSFLLALVISRKLSKVLTRIITPEESKQSIFAKARRFVLPFLSLLLPLLAFGFTAAGEGAVRAMFDGGSVIAFGKRVFLFLAARILVRDVVTAPLLKALGKAFIVPAAALYALGLLGPITEKLRETIVPLGNLSFDLLWLIQFIIVGGFIFWLGGWSNQQSTSYIGKQELKPATKQLAGKGAEIAIFGIAFIVLMSIMEINLASLAVIGGAIGVGLGFGLQKIASNFISGVILLLEGQATVGDFVELDGGEAGTIVKMTARAIILETFDGRWIVVPNEDFIITRVVNYSDQGSANRYEADFSVSYDTDINLVPDIVEKAVQAHPEVLMEPFPADCELRGFGDSGVDFAVEFWVNGLDDGKNKYTSDVLFLVWNALKENGIQIPYPHRVVEFKGQLPK